MTTIQNVNGSLRHVEVLPVLDVIAVNKRRERESMGRRVVRVMADGTVMVGK